MTRTQNVLQTWNILFASDKVNQPQKSINIHNASTLCIRDAFTSRITAFVQARVNVHVCMDVSGFTLTHDYHFVLYN